MTYGHNAFKGVFECKNPRKYVGDSTKIICRSSWERWFCNFLDQNPAVEKWASEEVSVMYTSPKDGRPHRYYIDYIVRFTNQRIVLIEIKPEKQTLPPAQPSNKGIKAQARFQEELQTYYINQAKWSTAKIFAQQNGMEFEVFTEKTLKSLGAPF